MLYFILFLSCDKFHYDFILVLGFISLHFLESSIYLWSACQYLVFHWTFSSCVIIFHIFCPSSFLNSAMILSFSGALFSIIRSRTLFVSYLSISGNSFKSTQKTFVVLYGLRLIWWKCGTKHNKPLIKYSHLFWQFLIFVSYRSR